MNKRGMSQIVTTIILILLILVAIGGIWAIVNNLIIKTSNKIGTDSLTLSLTLKSAKINYTTGLAEIRVRRNPGDGNLIGIKFIAEDKRNSDVFEERFESFPELAERTFTLNLSDSTFLELLEVHKISIAPIFSTGDGEDGLGGGGGIGGEQIGSIAGSIGGLNTNINLTIVEEENTPPGCESDADCPTDYLIPDTMGCDALAKNVVQYKKDYFCATGGVSYCDSTNLPVVVESCPTGTTCYDGACVEEKKACTIETDCGLDGWSGIPGCHSILNATVQDYKNYSCIDFTCNVEIISQIRKNCTDGEICFNGECFVPLECTSNNDCEFGKICEDGSCVDEEAILIGSIRSAWPFGIGEYFDSYDLPTDEQTVVPGHYLIFPGSNEDRCLQIQSFYAPSFEGAIPYVRLDVKQSNLSGSESFEIWETNYGCSLI